MILYQAYFVKGRSDRHYFLTGKVITVVGIVLSMGAAYFAKQYDNAMDIIQLVFGFVNAPIFATFLLGMFWKRTTGTGAFLGLFGGIASSALFHALTIAARQRCPAIKGGYLEVLQVFPSEMAQNFWLAVLCVHRLLHIDAGDFAGDQPHQVGRGIEGSGLFTHAKNQDLTICRFTSSRRVVGIILLIACVILNIIFW